MKLITITFGLFLGGITFAQNTFGDIIGTYTTSDKKEGLFGALVYTTRGEEIYRARTNEEGRFRISAIPAGIYKLTIVFEDDTTFSTKLVEVLPDGFGDAGIIAQKSTTILPDVVIVSNISLGRGVSPEIKLGKKDLKHLGTKFDAVGIVASMSSDIKLTEDGQLVFRGARKGDLVNYLDGVKTNGIQNVPSAALGYVMVYTGAIPAKYGDTTGGVVVMETLSYFDLLREYESR